MFTIESEKKVKEAWTSFVKNGEIQKDLIRKEIAESWTRSYESGLDPYSLDSPIISAEELEVRKEKSEDLLQIARPYMMNLYNFIQGSGFAVLITDENGYLLEVHSDEIFGANSKASPCVAGADRSEKSSGTNAVGTCLVLDEPVQIWAGEHYCQIRHEWTCSAAPIHDLLGKIIGCICISGPWNLMHQHTLGMVVAAADAIEKQMNLEIANRNISLTNSRLSETLNSISDGVIVIDKNRHILQINRPAAKLINTGSEQAVGTLIDEHIQSDDFFQNILENDLNMEQEEHKFNTKNGNLSLAVSTKAVSDDEDSREGLVITLREMGSVHKLVNKMTRNLAVFTFDHIIGKSEPYVDTIKAAKVAANSTSNLLITGESGTGKEMYAQAIHNHSPRKNAPFVVINCGAIPRGLVESELFGYERGSFTGAKKEGHPGKFELANGGTIFLDEIGDMPLEIQVILLRVLQSKEIIRVGGVQAKPVDVRIIAATHRDLKQAVDDNNFRLDLYYRLNVLSIAIPSLNQRKEDLPLLAEHFMKKYNGYLQKGITGIDTEVYDALNSYHWPGNIRELENVIERAINITQNKHITLEDLPVHFREAEETYTASVAKPYSNKIQTESNILPLKDLEMNAIIDALEICKGNVKKTAETLGMGRRTLYNKLEEYDIQYWKYRK